MPVAGPSRLSPSPPVAGPSGRLHSPLAPFRLWSRSPISLGHSGHATCAPETKCRQWLTTRGRSTGTLTRRSHLLPAERVEFPLQKCTFFQSSGIRGERLINGLSCLTLRLASEDTFSAGFISRMRSWIAMFPHLIRIQLSEGPVTEDVVIDRRRWLDELRHTIGQLYRVRCPECGQRIKGWCLESLKRYMGTFHPAEEWPVAGPSLHSPSPPAAVRDHTTTYPALSSTGMSYQVQFVFEENDCDFASSALDAWSQVPYRLPTTWSPIASASSVPDPSIALWPLRGPTAASTSKRHHPDDLN
ncbi:hypothetical protein B0H21DRAFT_566506 [Amylocystis lapponica]|nr:hypothetical protein B0H21DRAFT_566506 [Amylocystis lapponica]